MIKEDDLLVLLFIWLGISIWILSNKDAPTFLRILAIIPFIPP